MTELVVVRFVHISACAIAFGLLTFVFCLPSAGPGGDSTRTRLGHALRKWALAGGVLALATWLLWLLVLTPMMSGLPLAQAWSWPILEAVMTQTWFGTVWLVRVGLLLLFVLLLWPKRDLSARGLAFAAALVLAGLATAFIAGAGHANREAGVNGIAHLVSDGLHLLGAGAWLGGLPPLVIMFRDGFAPMGPGQHAKEVAIILNRFSDLAVWAVGSLAVGAAVNTWFMIPTIDSLWAHAYGWMLLAKTALLFLMMMLAAHNRLILAPRFTRESAAAAGSSVAATLRRNILIEIGAGTIILIVVSVMGITSP
jgi:putative copper resistance protein D